MDWPPLKIWLKIFNPTLPGYPWRGISHRTTLQSTSRLFITARKLRGFQSRFEVAATELLEQLLIFDEEEGAEPIRTCTAKSGIDYYEKVVDYLPQKEPLCPMPRSQLLILPSSSKDLNNQLEKEHWLMQPVTEKQIKEK